ncbi:MAG TPA: energy transducer TonB [Bacteroidia bacterium]|nr:energy transducer TonB [Bacteroidia bacterium]
MKTILLPFLLVLTFTCFDNGVNGQNVTKYYCDKSLKQECEQNKATYAMMLILNSDGSLTREVRDLRKNQLLKSETRKGDEPWGIWYYQKPGGYDTLDYFFDLQYSDEACKSDTTCRPTNPFQDDPSIGYISPKLEGQESSLFRFVSKTLYYPIEARELGKEGKVILNFKINTKGEVEDILVLKGTHVQLDKEAVRVLRKLKFRNPATLNGEARHLCMNLPISFKLQ